MDLSPNLSSCQTDVLLDRPFLRTAKAKIDCSEWSITLECFGHTAKFNVSDRKSIPNSHCSVNYLDVVQPIVEKADQLKTKNCYEIVLCSSSTPSRSIILSSIAGTAQGLATPFKTPPLKSDDVRAPTWEEEDEEVTDKTRRT